MELNQEKRGTYVAMDYVSKSRVKLIYELPLSEIVFDYFDQLKSRTKGYASLDYELCGYKETDLVKIDVLPQWRNGGCSVVHCSSSQVL